jgi:hypothetical protein
MLCTVNPRLRQVTCDSSHCWGAGSAYDITILVRSLHATLFNRILGWEAQPSYIDATRVDLSCDKAFDNDVASIITVPAERNI